jgi:hypothetical protein
MKKILNVLVFLAFATAGLAVAQISVPKVWLSNELLTSTDLNNNFAQFALALPKSNPVVTGTLGLNGRVYTWPGGETAGSVLITNGSGTLAWGSGSIGACGVRLTLTSGTPVTTADVTAATSVFATPMNGGQCSFYDGVSAWQEIGPLNEVTISVPATTNTNYDVFCFNNSRHVRV